MDSIDEQILLDHFSLHTKTLNKFQITDKDLVEEYIEAFKGLPIKQTALSNFLSAEPLKKDIFTSKLINLALGLIVIHLSDKNSSG